MKKSSALQRENLIVLIILMIVFLITLSFYIIYGKEKIISQDLQIAKVISVIDGDTFIIDSGEKVRLICVDTPEENEKGYQEAKQFLENLILNKQIRLEKDVSETDKFGRLLRYAYINGTNSEIFVNKEIIKNNLGTLFPYGNDTKKCEEISLK